MAQALHNLTTIEPMGKPREKNKLQEKMPEKMAERIRMLGISDKEMTPAVNLAVSALLEKLDDLTRELVQTKENLTEIEQLVDVDCVALIPNRRAFMRRLGWAINMHERYGHPSTILYFDVNDFKEINDLHGHAAGDAAIRHIAELVSGAMRESDFLARIGGDEFAVIMYYASEESALRRGEKIVEKLHATPFSVEEKTLHVNVAYGCHAIAHGETAETALAAADKSMYADKRRNKANAG